jgi:3-isopropylmalate dehydrogenase
MKDSYRIVVLPGDGIGPEIIQEAHKVLTAVSEMDGFGLEFEHHLIGGAAIDLAGTPLPQATVDACRNADAVLLGAVGGPKWDANPPELRPEKGLLGIRKTLQLYTNLRPVKLHPALLDASTLKPEVVDGTDLLVVRELTGGIYFGQPRFTETVDGTARAVDTMVYDEHEIRRIAIAGFEAARGRRCHLTSVDKANVLDTSRLWRKVVTEVGADYPDITLEHMLVDNCAMQLIRNPRQFDVIVTENMFGDILSDEASMLAGSIGMLASASLGEGAGLFEPAHGSAPDIAGKGIANPLATIASAALMLRHSLGRTKSADRIETAITTVLDQGFRCADIKQEGTTVLGTVEMGDKVVAGIRDR